MWLTGWPHHSLFQSRRRYLVDSWDDREQLLPSPFPVGCVGSKFGGAKVAGQTGESRQISSDEYFYPDTRSQLPSHPRQVFEYSHTTADGKLSFSLNSILLSCGDSVRRGGDLDDSRSEPIITRLRSLMRTGAALVSWIPVVWRERTRSWGWNRAGFRHRLRSCV